MTETTTTALTALDEAKQHLTTSQYEAIRAGLLTAQDLRAVPGREATASTLARNAGEFRRQPHLDGAPAPTPTARPEAQPAAAPAPAERAHKPTTDYGRARIIH
jgi:hypothetical protein